MNSMPIVLINSGSLFSSEKMSSNSYFKESICWRPGATPIAVPVSTISQENGNYTGGQVIISIKRNDGRIMLAWSCGAKRPRWTQPTFFPSSEQVVLWSVSGGKHLTAFHCSLAAEVFAPMHQVFYLTILVLVRRKFLKKVSSTFPFLSKVSQVCPSGVSLLFLTRLDRLLWSPADLGEIPLGNTLMRLLRSCTEAGGRSKLQRPED